MRITIEGLKETYDVLDDIVDQYPYETVVAVTEDVYRNAMENLKPHWRTGRLENNLTYRVHRNPTVGEVYVQDNGMMVEWDLRRVNYAMFVHFGTRPHEITPKHKKALRWTSMEKFVFAKRVEHPGYKGDPFLYNALQETMSKLDQIFTKVYDGL